MAKPDLSRCQDTRGDILTASPRRVGLPLFETMPPLPLAAIHAPVKPSLGEFDFSLEVQRRKKWRIVILGFDTARQKMVLQ